MLNYKIEFDRAVVNVAWRNKISVEAVKLLLKEHIDAIEKQFVPPPEPDDLATQVKREIAKLATARRGLRN